jgi:hypothetical protein
MYLKRLTPHVCCFCFAQHSGFSCQRAMLGIALFIILPLMKQDGLPASK